MSPPGGTGVSQTLLNSGEKVFSEIRKEPQVPEVKKDLFPQTCFKPRPDAGKWALDPSLWVSEYVRLLGGDWSEGL